MFDARTGYRWLLPALALWLSACLGPQARDASPIAATKTFPKKETMSIAWMDNHFAKEITDYVPCQEIGVLVTTRGYAPGESIEVKVSSTDDDDTELAPLNVTLHGTVNADGKVRIRWLAGEDCGDDEATPASSPAPATDRKSDSEQKSAIYRIE